MIVPDTSQIENGRIFLSILFSADVIRGYIRRVIAVFAEVQTSDLKEFSTLPGWSVSDARTEYNPCCSVEVFCFLDTRQGDLQDLSAISKLSSFRLNFSICLKRMCRDRLTIPPCMQLSVVSLCPFRAR